MHPICSHFHNSDGKHGPGHLPLQVAAALPGLHRDGLSSPAVHRPCSTHAHLSTPKEFLHQIVVFQLTGVSCLVARRPINQGIVDERLQKRQQGLPSLLHHFQNMLTRQPKDALKQKSILLKLTDFLPAMPFGNTKMYLRGSF